MPLGKNRFFPRLESMSSTHELCWDIWLLSSWASGFIRRPPRSAGLGLRLENRLFKQHAGSLVNANLERFAGGLTTPASQCQHLVAGGYPFGLPGCRLEC